MSIEQLISENTAALAELTEQMKVMNTGREEALAKLTEATAKPAPKKRQTAAQKKAAEAAEASKGKETKEEPKGKAAAKSDADVSDVALREFVGGWLKESDDPAVQADRGAKLKTILEHFGADTLVGDTGIKEDAERQQAIFFIKRFQGNMDVDFSADYDFDADPLTQGEAAAPAVDDILG